MGPHGYPASSWVGVDPSPWLPLLWPGCEGSLPPCSSSSVFLRDVVTLSGLLVSFVPFDRERRWPLEGFFLLGGSLPCRGKVIFSLRPRSFGHSSYGLVSALFSSLSLFFPVPIFWLPLRLTRGLGCATLLSLWLCAHLLSGLGFPMLPDCPSPSIRLWVYWFQWLIFSTGVPYLRDGVTPAGSKFVCPRS